MASGFGYSGGRTRCFPFWQEFQKCYASADKPEDCIAQKEDYMECLHHTKEIARAKTIKAHYIERAKREAKEARERGELAATGGILSLGLIERNGDGAAEERGKAEGGAAAGRTKE